MADTSQHMVKSYDQELVRLADLISEMGGIVENQVALAAEALATRDRMRRHAPSSTIRRSTRSSVRSSNS